MSTETPEESAPPGLSAPIAPSISSAPVSAREMPPTPVKPVTTRTEQLMCRIGELIGDIDVERLHRMSAEQEARRAREKAEWMHKQAADVDLGTPDGTRGVGEVGTPDGTREMGTGRDGGSELGTLEVNAGESLARNTADQVTSAENALSEGLDITVVFPFSN